MTTTKSNIQKFNAAVEKFDALTFGCFDKMEAHEIVNYCEKSAASASTANHAQVWLEIALIVSERIVSTSPPQP